MGQYYHPAILAEETNDVIAWMYSHDYDNGLKLMEHSWMLNPFVHRFEHLISPDGKFHKSRVVWAGDYADPEPGKVYYDGGKEYEANIYDLCADETCLKNLPKVDGTKYRYVVNHTKKEYVDKTKVKDVDGWKIHPLPLLTCEGNGRGGGDYYPNNKKEKSFIGRWARDVISVEYEIPTANYKEIKFPLYEKW